MLGAVVHENPLDVAHMRDAPEIQHEDEYLHKSLYQVFEKPQPASRRRIERAGQKDGQPHKEQKPDADSQNRGDAHYDADKLAA